MQKFILSRRARDITGQTFTRLTAIEPVRKNKHDKVVWRCKCECGSVLDVPANSLLRGNTRSCGCLQRERASEAVSRGPNDHRVADGIAYLTLTNRAKESVGVVQVDEEDLDLALSRRWHLSGNGYAVYKYNRTPILLHRLIAERKFGPLGDAWVDHKNRDKLDCRRDNIRIANASLNGANISVVRSSSGYKGVSRRKDKWRARIKKDGKEIYVGTYATPEEAALAYDRKALELFGEYACLNTAVDRTTVPRVLAISDPLLSVRR